MDPPAAERREPRWPASLAILGALLLYITLPGRFTLGPPLVLPVLEGALLVSLTVRAPYRHPGEARLIRVASIALIGLVNLANLGSLVLLLRAVVTGAPIDGRTLIGSGVRIWLTMILGFALVYWELDRGGPGLRGGPRTRPPDFLFPQMATPELHQPDWMPAFIDYFYLAFTNATAFSPTDALPLTPWAKVLMLAESLAAITTVVMVAGRAVNILV